MTGTRPLRALLRLARAHLAGRSVRIRFLHTESATTERTVDVLALVFDPPRWLVAAWSRELRSLRLLDVARVVWVAPTRRRAGAPPEGFDPVHFALRRLRDPDAGPMRETAVRLHDPWARVAPALLPSARLERGPGGGAVLHLRTTRPELLEALAASLADVPALDSPSRPCRPPADR